MAPLEGFYPHVASCRYTCMGAGRVERNAALWAPGDRAAPGVQPAHGPRARAHPSSWPSPAAPPPPAVPAGRQDGALAPPGGGAGVCQLRRQHQAVGRGGRRVDLYPDAGRQVRRQSGCMPGKPKAGLRARTGRRGLWYLRRWVACQRTLLDTAEGWWRLPGSHLLFLLAPPPLT